jgi:hypothetical protein
MEQSINQSINQPAHAPAFAKRPTELSKARRWQQSGLAPCPISLPKFPSSPSLRTMRIKLKLAQIVHLASSKSRRPTGCVFAPSPTDRQDIPLY